MAPIPRLVIDRFNEKWILGPGGCWLWTASVTQGETGGYAQLGIGHAGVVKAHRWAYEHFIGQVPDGLELDHVCRVRRCVNPWHLEPVTHGENVRRGDHPNRRKTRCPNGHPYDGIGNKGERICRVCIAAARHRRREVMA